MYIISFFRPTSLLVAFPLGNSGGFRFFRPTGLSGGLPTRKCEWNLIFSANQLVWWPSHLEIRVEFNSFGQPACWWPPHSEIQVGFHSFGQPVYLVASPPGNSGGFSFFRPTSLPGGLFFINFQAPSSFEWLSYPVSIQELINESQVWNSSI